MTTTTHVPDTTNLDPIDGFEFPVFTSHGSRSRAVSTAQRAQRCINWLTGALGQCPRFSLFVVDIDDWDRVAVVPLYGMPHAFGDRVVVGVQPGSFWQEMSGVVVPQLPAAGVVTMREIYGDPPDLGRCFPDLIIAHELTHLFHAYDEHTLETDFPQLWL